MVNQWQTIDSQWELSETHMGYDCGAYLPIEIPSFACYI